MYFVGLTYMAKFFFLTVGCRGYKPNFDKVRMQVFLDNVDKELLKLASYV